MNTWNIVMADLHTNK